MLHASIIRASLWAVPALIARTYCDNMVAGKLSPHPQFITASDAEGSPRTKTAMFTLLVKRVDLATT